MKIRIPLGDHLLGTDERAPFPFFKELFVRGARPAAVPQNVHLCIARIGGDLPAGYERKPRFPRGGALFGKSFQAVVIGHGNQVEPRLRSAARNLVRGIFPVRIVCVNVQIRSHRTIFPSRILILLHSAP